MSNKISTNFCMQTAKDSMTVNEEEKEPNKLPEGVRIFRSARYLVALEPKTYGTFFDIIQEEENLDTHDKVREKVKSLGPTAIYRECEEDEKEDLETFHPTEKRLMKLKLISKS